MEQQQSLPAFKVTLSLRTKLLLSTAILLLAVIGFLNLSAILLLTNDKQAYTYQAQSVEASLTGKQLISIVRHSLDTLRAVLAGVDPTHPLPPAEISFVQNTVLNQSDLLNVSVGLYDPKAGTWNELTHASKDDELKRLSLQTTQLVLTASQIQSVLPQLQSGAFAFVNLSNQTMNPMLGLLFADLKFLTNPAGIPIAFGAISLNGFSATSSGNELAVSTRAGQLLFDTDPSKLFSSASMNSDPLFKSAVASGVANGALEFDADGGKYLGSYSLPGFDLVVLSRSLYQKAMRSTYTLTEKFIFLGGMAVAISVILALFFARTITAPIRNLYDGTQKISEGDFSQEVTVRTKDEIGALTNSFNFMSKKIMQLLKDSIEKVRLDNELAIASTVQQTLIPSEFFEDERISIRSHYQAASECGGDWWGFFSTGEKMAIMIADATGHGLPSALITASARSCFSVLQKVAEEDALFSYSPAEMLQYANRVISDASQGKIMMTFFIAVVDFSARTLTYSSAGHNPPWLFKKEGRTQSLVASGLRLGETRDLPAPEELTTSFEMGDVLLLYTDGLLEGTNAEGEQYGKKRARKLAESLASQGPEALIQGLVAEFMAHNGNKALDDDVTLAAIKLQG